MSKLPEGRYSVLARVDKRGRLTVTDFDTYTPKFLKSAKEGPDRETAPRRTKSSIRQQFYAALADAVFEKL